MPELPAALPGRGKQYRDSGCAPRQPPPPESVSGSLAARIFKLRNTGPFLVMVTVMVSPTAPAVTVAVTRTFTELSTGLQVRSSLTRSPGSRWQVGLTENKSESAARAAARPAPGSESRCRGAALAAAIADDAQP